MNLRLDDIARNLPAYGIADEVNRSLAANPRLVVTAPPGAGKSTLLPLTMLEGTNGGGKILMLEPRRIAAVQIAGRMAELAGCRVGDEVGYRIRFENRTSGKTRIEVLTEGILGRMLVADPALEGVSAVIFDEFHERSLASDEALALVLEAQRILRPDLRIIIMSATIDTDEICGKLGAPLIEGKGRMFPVELRYAQKDIDLKNPGEEVARCVFAAHRDNEGDILAFLPGEAGIRRCAELLEGNLGGTRIFPLYGMLPKEEQRRAIAPSRPGERKVVLATSIAETSLTIEGVRVVVDSGLCRKMIFDRRNGMSHLETVRISIDMADQRSGRAGRTAPGVCYRLWTAGTMQRMQACRTPEISDCDLAPLRLDIAAWGESDMMNLPWITLPPKANVIQAESLLRSLGAIDVNGRITKHGRAMSALPCHPRIAQMLLRADTPELRSLATDIAAILEERDPMPQDNDADLRTRVNALRQARGKGGNLREWGRIEKIAAQYRSMAKALTDNDMPAPYATGLLLSAAYPERIAKARDGCGHYQLSCGDNAFVDSADELSSHEWLAGAVMDSVSGRMFLAAPVDPEDLEDIASARSNILWDSRKGGISALRELKIGVLTLSARPIGGDIREAVLQAICDAAPKDGLSMFDFSDEVGNLQRRIGLASSWHPELELPDVSQEALLDNAAEWLPAFAGNASTVAELRRINLCEVIWSRLTYSQQQAVDRIVPSHITVPTGSRIKVEYRIGNDVPVVRVRLQECFGLLDTPRVDDGRIPVLMDLLSPGYKSVQLTSDLRSFWADAYFEVRKELRRRYPKHSWPDNPAEAMAVRGVKKPK